MIIFQGNVSGHLRIGLTIAVVLALATFTAVFFLLGMTQPLAFDLAVIIALTSFLLRLILERAGQIRVVLSGQDLYFTAGAVDSDQVLEIKGLLLRENPDDWVIQKDGKTRLCLKKRWFSPSDRVRLAAELQRLFSESACEIQTLPRI